MMVFLSYTRDHPMMVFVIHKDRTKMLFAYTRWPYNDGFFVIPANDQLMTVFFIHTMAAQRWFFYRTHIGHIMLFFCYTHVTAQ